MLESTKIKAKTFFVGANDDVIINTSPGVWDFGGASIENVVIQTTGGFSGLGKVVFVAPTFSGTGNFKNTIQDAIDYVRAQNIVNPTIIIFPGVYEENIDIDTINSLSIIGIGKVQLNLIAAGGAIISPITITSSSNISIKNISLIDPMNVLNECISSDFISIENSTCTLDNISLNFTTETVTDLNIVKITSPVGTINLKNLNFQIDYIGVAPLFVEDNINFIYSEDAGTSGFIKIDNCKFKLSVDKKYPDIDTLVAFLNAKISSGVGYRYMINNSEFEYNSLGEIVHFELFKCYTNAEFPVSNYGTIAFFNSFTNNEWDEGIVSNNIYFNSNFKILF